MPGSIVNSVPVNGFSGFNRWYLHLSIPVFRLSGRRPEDFQMPLAAAPGLDDIRGDDVDEDLGEGAMFGIVLEPVRLVVPLKRRIDEQREEEIVAVVDDEELPDRALLSGVIDEVLLGAVGADVALQRELARDDVLDGDFLVPAVAAVALVAARL